MKRFALSLLAVLAFSTGFSQKHYFVYLQAEPEQPFFVRMNDRIYSSTGSGYLILSRMKDSIYAISIGFPENKWPEQKFTIGINARDHGYSLKNFGEKGWGLYDIGQMSVQMSAAGSGTIKTEPKEVSAFTEILSKAANDPSLKERTIAVKEEKPPVVKEDKTIEPVAAVTKEEVKPSKDSTIVVNQQSTAEAKNDSKPVDNKVDTKVEPALVENKEEKSAGKNEESPVADAKGEKKEIGEEYKPSVVTRKSESSMTDGLHLTFIDDYGNGKKDTVRIIIPNPKNNLAEIKPVPKEQKKFLDMPDTDSVKGAGVTKSTEPVQKEVNKDSLAAVAATKKNCPVIAAEADFFRVRRNMAAETNDEAMIAVAKKTFRAKCFSATQVKNLSALFLNDAGKYKFFDMAYEYVSDKENFPALVSELKDEYYINRFKAMLRPA